MLGTITVVPGACAAWRRGEVLAVGGFAADTLAEDCDLTLNLQRAGGKIVQDNTALAFTEAPQGLRPCSSSGSAGPSATSRRSASTGR